MTKKMERKYIPLAEFFRNTLQNEITLSYEELENITGQQLPNAAYLNTSWWTKTKSPLNHYLAWLDADFTVVNVQLGTSISFLRNGVKRANETENGYRANTVIRPIDLLDARPFINLQSAIFNTATYEYYVQNEYTMSVQQIKKNMSAWKNSNNTTVLLAIFKGQHAGYINIMGGRTQRQSHVATIRFGVLPQFEQKGIAENLLEKSIIWAKAHNITKLEATVVTENEQANKLLKKFGFELEGTRKSALRIDEQYFDEHYYSKILN